MSNSIASNALSTTDRRESPLVRHARREAIIAGLIWLAAGSYTVGYCSQLGYGLSPDDVTFVWGMPSWIVFGVFAPWLVCTAISWIFSFCVMADDPLDAAEQELLALHETPLADRKDR